MNTNDFNENIYSDLRKTFYDIAKKIINYEIRTLSDDTRRHEYKNELINAYNEFLKYTNTHIRKFTQESKEKVTKNFTDSYEKYFVRALRALRFQAQIPELFHEIDIENIEFIELEGIERSDNLIDLENQSSSSIENTEQNLNEINFLPILNNTNMTLSKAEFLNMCSRTINSIYSGDPLGLNPLLNSVELLETMAETDEHRNVLPIFLKAKLQGVAQPRLRTI